MDSGKELKNKRRTDGQMKRTQDLKTDRRRGRRKDGKTEGQKDRKTEAQKYRMTERQKDIMTERQIGRHPWQSDIRKHVSLPFLFFTRLLIAIPSIFVLLFTASLKSALSKLLFFFLTPSRGAAWGAPLPELPMEESERLLPPYECRDRTEPDRFRDNADLKVQVVLKIN